MDISAGPADDDALQGENKDMLIMQLRESGGGTILHALRGEAGMIGRTFIDLEKDIDLNEIKDKLEQERKSNIPYHSKNETYVIEEIKTGQLKDFFPAIDGTDSRDFLPIILKINISAEDKIPVLNSSQTDIEIKQERVNIHKYLFFWLFQNKIIFSKISDSRKYLIDILENIFGFKINIPFYDVSKIYNELKSLNNIGAYGFYKRKNSANSGSIFISGQLDDRDPMVKETDLTDKSFVHLKRVLPKSPNIDFTVYGTGAIVINKNWYNMQSYINEFQEIKDFLTKYEKPKL